MSYYIGVINIIRYGNSIKYVWCGKRGKRSVKRILLRYIYIKEITRNNRL